ncbi:MAG: ArsB/NhaD family transporter [Akkermansia sp.]
MSTTAWLAIIIFVASYTLIISEKVHRTIAALMGGVLMILCGIISQEKALTHIDFNTLGLLVGMMIMVIITIQSGLFNYLSIWTAKKAKGNPVVLLIFLSILTAVCSAFLDNVTTVLLTVPITLSITSKLKVTPTPFIFSQIMASNIGGTATLIGDPPNIMIGSAVKELDFMAFLTNLSGVCTIILIVTVSILLFIYRKDLKTTDELKAGVMRMDERRMIKRPRLLRKCLFVLGLTIGTFMLHSHLNIQTGTVALSGAAILMMLTLSRNGRILNRIFSKVEWTAIFFFVGLFIMVGALVETGVIGMMAEKMMMLTKGDLTATAMTILGFGAVMSAFVDNIPFVATMIPLIKDMGLMGMTNLTPLWWALSLGACLGGNGTIIGASANVVAIAIAAQRGYRISFTQYMKIAFPLMLLSVVISAVFLYVEYL